MSTNNLVQCLTRLKNAITPPPQPIGLGARVPVMGFPQLPSDLYSFIDLYGSGFFQNGGLFLTVLNPYEPDYAVRENSELETFRNLQQAEGPSYIPFSIYPIQPGLLLWGYGESRKHFFWLADGSPDTWPVIVIHDLEIVTRFDMTMTSFLEQLLCGDLDCSFIGGVETVDNRVNPQSLQFIAGSPPL